MSHLIWIYAVCKSLLLSPVAMKELTLSAPKDFRRHLSSACYFCFDKLSLGETFIRNVERLNVKQRRSWIYAVCKKPVIIACVSERVKWKEKALGGISGCAD